MRCLAQHMQTLQQDADACAEAAGLAPAALAGCAAGEEGGALEQGAAEETWALRPRHTFVPWVSGCGWVGGCRCSVGCVRALGGLLGARTTPPLSHSPHARTHTLTPPPHTQVVVNGVALGGDFERLERYVCACAPAARRPGACAELPPTLQRMGGRRR